MDATLGGNWGSSSLDPTAPGQPSPAADGLRSRLRLLPLLPSAIRFDRRLQRETPSGRPGIAALLSERTGHHFPVLQRLHSRRALRSIASMLRQNLDPASSVVGIELKVLAGAIFAEVVADEHSADDIRGLARHAGIRGEVLRDAIAYANRDESSSPAGTRSASASLALARAASYSPARIDPSTVDACRESGLTPAAIVEIISWLSVLQMLHRLTCYVTIAD